MLAILSTPLRDLASVWDRFAAWRIAREKLALVLNRPATRRRPTKIPGGSEIIFSAVRFRGLEAQFRISAGETVLVSGSHGSGKTSLLRLAAGLDEPEEGRVGYGGDPYGGMIKTVRGLGYRFDGDSADDRPHRSNGNKQP